MVKRVGSTWMIALKTRIRVCTNVYIFNLIYYGYSLKVDMLIFFFFSEYDFVFMLINLPRIKFYFNLYISNN